MTAPTDRPRYDSQVYERTDRTPEGNVPDHTRGVLSAEPRTRANQP